MGKKDKYYFSHDSNARRDPKMISLINKKGSEGYGMFWILIEILREQEDFKIDITKSYAISSLSAEMKTTDDHVKEFISECIRVELIESDGVFIWSNSLNERMSIYKQKIERFSSMGKKSQESRKKSPTLLKSNNDEQEEIKERQAPAKSQLKILEDDDSFRIILESLLKLDEFKNLTREHIVSQRNKAVDWAKSKGKRYKNYESYFKNWLRNSDVKKQETSNNMVY